MKKLIVLLLVFGFLFADIGPSPLPPEINIYLLQNGELYLEDFSITYKCADTILSEESPVGQSTIEFGCFEGLCTHSGWFYKLNPCFSDANGYFIYYWGGQEMQSQNFTFYSEESYALSLELTTGKLTEKNIGKDPDKGGVCPISLLILSSVVSIALRN
jgi:hypothetical protein